MGRVARSVTVVVGLGALATGVALAATVSRQGLAETAVPPVPGVELEEPEAAGVAGIAVVPAPGVLAAVVAPAAVVPATEPVAAAVVPAAAVVAAEPAGVFNMGAEVVPPRDTVLVALLVAGTAVGLSPQASRVMHSSKATSARPVYLNFKIDNV